MITHRPDTRLNLFRFSEVEGLQLPQLAASDIDALSTAREWSLSYLCHPHTDLGRRGPVCPFAKQAIELHNSMYMGIIPSAEHSAERVRQVLRQCQDAFDELSPARGPTHNLKTVVVVLPGVPGDEKGAEFMYRMHNELKPEFVERSRMLGQFYPRCTDPGLHNPEYSPFRAPVSLFAIRHMQITDLPFLVHRDDYVRAYCTTFRVASANDLARLVARYRIAKLPHNWDSCVDRVFNGSAVTVH